MSVFAGRVPVLEIGGTHVTAALVSVGEGLPIVVEQHRRELQADATAPEIVNGLAAAATLLEVQYPVAWGIAIPGPFDYENGIGLFEGVGKFDALHGFDLRRALTDALYPRPTSIRFVNDADAFGLGECAAGAGRYHDRAVCLTLGTGVGSSFIADGTLVNRGPDVPPAGSAHLLTWRGAPLEDTVSRRAIRDHYQFLTNDALDVREIAERARLREAPATQVLNTAMQALGEAMAPWIESFRATVVVVGGSISGSWDLLERPLRVGLSASRPRLQMLPLSVAQIPHDAPLIGVAAHIHAPG